MSATRKPRGDDQAEAPSGDAVRPVVPAIPSESGVGEEDPGDFENASIRSDDGKRPSVPPRKPGSGADSVRTFLQPRNVPRG